MQVLGGPPGAMAAILAQVLNHQTQVLEMANARFGMAKPEALRVCPDQGRGAFDQFGRRRGGRRQFVQLIRRGSHAHTLRSRRPNRKDRLKPGLRFFVGLSLLECPRRSRYHLGP